MWAKKNIETAIGKGGKRERELAAVLNGASKPALVLCHHYHQYFHCPGEAIVSPSLAAPAVKADFTPEFPGYFHISSAAFILKSQTPRKLH